MNPSSGIPETRTDDQQATTTTADRRPSSFARFLARSRRPFRRISSTSSAAAPRPAQPAGASAAAAAGAGADGVAAASTSAGTGVSATQPAPPTSQPPTAEAPADTTAAAPADAQAEPDVAAGTQTLTIRHPHQPEDVQLQRALSLTDTSTIRIIRHVKRVCHRCGSSFIQADRKCHCCRHHLCSRCPRDPASAATHVHIRSDGESESGGEHPTRPHRVYERTHKKARLRIRYTCDQCTRMFEEKRKTCSWCGHELCEKCDRDPPKRSSLTGRPADLPRSSTEQVSLPAGGAAAATVPDAAPAAPSEAPAATGPGPPQSGVDAAFGV